VETSLLNYPRKKDLAKIGNDIYQRFSPHGRIDSNNYNKNVDNAAGTHQKNQNQKNLMTFCSKQRLFMDMKSRKTTRLTSKKKWNFMKQLKNALKCLEN